MRRELQTRKTLRRCPLKQTIRTNTARIKRIPMMLTNTLPAAFRLGRPIAMGAANARVCRTFFAVVKNLLVNVGLGDGDRKADLRFSLLAHIH